MKDFSDYQYSAIPEGELEDGDVFVCQTVDIFDPFNDWDYAVAIKGDPGVSVMGKFKDKSVACIFARAI